MTKSEFKTVAEDVFAELLPKVKTADRTEAINELLNELEANGLEIDDDEEDLEEDDEDTEE
jgi:hypothetical protein